MAAVCRARSKASPVDDPRLQARDPTQPPAGVRRRHPAPAITTADIDAYREQLLAEGRLRPRTINKRLAQLHAIFKRAQRVYGLEANPAALAERQPYRRSGDFQVLEPRDVELLAASASNEQDAVIFTVAAFSGLRLGELRGLRWGDVGWMLRLIHVRRSYVEHGESAPKSGRVRSVPLVDQAARALDRLSRREHWTDDDDLVFVNPTGGHIEDSALRRRFYDALEARAHRTFASTTCDIPSGRSRSRRFHSLTSRRSWVTPTSRQR